ncbi:hypothetical protein AC1031_010167 [Aphanomyces cochlioides]|nr:hypothetical protein AC1031_010167 [Aphanomyces cochlioides]
MNAEVAVTMAAMIAATAAATADGRASRAQPSRKFTIRSQAWADVQAQTGMDGCEGAVEVIVRRIQYRWDDVNEPLHHNTIFTIKDRVAVAHYFTHSGGYAESGQVFGISESRAHCYVGQVMPVIMLFLQDTILLPQTMNDWADKAAIF